MTSELIHTKKRHKQVILACIMKSFYNFHSFDIFYFFMQASPRKWVTSELFGKLVINFHYFLESFYHWGLARSQTRHLDSRCVWNFTQPMHAVSSTCHQVNCCYNFFSGDIFSQTSDLMCGQTNWILRIKAYSLLGSFWIDSIIKCGIF